MEYIYAELVRNGRTLASVPKSKIVGTAVILIISKNKTIEDVPEKYKAETLEELAAQGYDGYGEPTE
jgi:kynurenine formamidase